MVSSSGLVWALLHHGRLRMINYCKVIQGCSVTVPVNQVADILLFLKPGFLSHIASFLLHSVVNWSLNST